MKIQNTNRFIVMLSILVCLSTSLIYQMITYGFITKAGIMPSMLPGLTAPTIISISPTSSALGSGDIGLTVNGTNFTSSLNSYSQVLLNTQVLPLDQNLLLSNSSTVLYRIIPASYLTTAGSFSVKVINPNGSISNSMSFTVNTSLSGGITILSGVSPNSVELTAINASGVDIQLAGTNFQNGSSVKIRKTNATYSNTGVVIGTTYTYTSLQTTYLSVTSLRATIPNSELSEAGLLDIVVVSPNGTVSNPQTFTIRNPVPTSTGYATSQATSSLSPYFISMNSAVNGIFVGGSNFVNGSVVRFNNSNRPTHFVSSSELNFDLYPSDTQNPGVFPITVFNPGPGGGTSNVVNMYIYAGKIELVKRSFESNGQPSNSNSSFGFILNKSLILTGSTNPVPVSSFSLNTTSGYGVSFLYSLKQESYSIIEGITSGWFLSERFCLSDDEPTGTQITNGVQITTSNGALYKCYFDNTKLVPTITNISPQSTNATNINAPNLQVTVNGTNFIPQSVVIWYGGLSLSTQYVSSNQLIATIPSAYIRTPGTYYLWINSGSFAGGSNTVNFIVNP